MSKTYSGKDVQKALLKKGFEVFETHHHYLYLIVGGKRTAIKTKVSHGRLEYKKDLWSALRKQLKLNTTQLERLLDCPMDHEEYTKILMDDGHI